MDYDDAALKLQTVWAFIKKFRLYFAIILVGFLLRLLLISNFPSPFIFADETVYFKTARDIWHLYFSSDSYIFSGKGYPPGYSVVISIAHIFYDLMLAYKTALIINIVLSTLALIPIYLILRQFIDQKPSIIITTILYFSPQLFLYNFVVMSENLFIPLVLLSMYLVIVVFSKQTSKFYRLFALAVFLFLPATRIPGAVMLAVFFILSIIYNLKGVNTKKIFYVLFILSIFCLVLIYFQVVPLNLSDNSKVFAYDITYYLYAFSGIFSDIGSIILFIRLFIHEVDYLIISSFFVFFALYLYPLLRHKEFDKKFLTTHLYVSMALVGTIVLTILHMYPAYVGGDLEYDIFGRYLDPLVIPIFLIGFIVLEKYGTVIMVDGKLKKTFLFAFILMAFLFVATFPTDHYKFPSTMPICYIISLQEYVSVMWVYLAFLILLLLILCARSRKVTSAILLFIFCISIYFPVSDMIRHSVNTEGENRIAVYLNKNTEESSIVLFDRYNHVMPWSSNMFFLIDFWNNGRTYAEGTYEEKDLGSSIYNISKGFDYLVSIQIREYTPVMKFHEYYLYANKTLYFEKLEGGYTLDVGSEDEFNVEGTYPSEVQHRWTKNYSKFRLDFASPEEDIQLLVKLMGHRPLDNPANVTFFMNDNYIGNYTKGSGEQIIQLHVPKEYLRNDFQLLGVMTNTWNPMGINESEDSRDLGVAVDWIKTVPADYPSSVDVGYNDELFVENFHDKERNPDNTTFRWSRNYSRVTLKVPENASNLKVEIRMGGWRTDNAPEPRVNLFVDDTMLTVNMTVTNRLEVYSFNVTKDIVGGKNTVDITIESNVWKPSYYTNTPDNRELGVVVDWVKVEKLDNDRLNQADENHLLN